MSDGVSKRMGNLSPEKQALLVLQMKKKKAAEAAAARAAAAGMPRRPDPSVPAPLAMVHATAPLALCGAPASPPVDTCHSRDSANEVFHPPRA